MIASDARKFIEAALEKLTPAKAQEIARSMVQGQGKEQVQKFAKDLMDWSSKNRERMVEFVRREVQAQLKLMGVASREELEALKKRVHDLERASAPKPAAAAKKRTVAKKTAAKPTATKRTAAKRSPAKRSTAEEPG
jgi:polyhydroxyalkanoate synthesis regulator phasin